VLVLKNMTIIDIVRVIVKSVAMRVGVESPDM
jgi:hypothetical protein